MTSPPPPDDTPTTDEKAIEEVVDQLVEDEIKATPSSKKRVPRGPECTACGSINRNVDPDVMRRARGMAKKPSRSLGFLGSDDKRR